MQPTQHHAQNLVRASVLVGLNRLVEEAREALGGERAQHLVLVLSLERRDIAGQHVKRLEALIRDGRPVVEAIGVDRAETNNPIVRLGERLRVLRVRTLFGTSVCGERVRDRAGIIRG